MSQNESERVRMSNDPRVTRSYLGSLRMSQKESEWVRMCQNESKWVKMRQMSPESKWVKMCEKLDRKKELKT